MYIDTTSGCMATAVCCMLHAVCCNNASVDTSKNRRRGKNIPRNIKQNAMDNRVKRHKGNCDGSDVLLYGPDTPHTCVCVCVCVCNPWAL